MRRGCCSRGNASLAKHITANSTFISPFLYIKRRGERQEGESEREMEEGRNRLPSTQRILPSTTRRDTKCSIKLLKGLSTEVKEGTFFLNIIFSNAHTEIKLFLEL